MDIDEQHLRYDRQIRLWGNEGQLSIQQTRICVFGSSALAAEILKSLVLAGIGSFHIVDNALVDESDLGQNFFTEEKAMRRFRGECLVQLLMELNPSVHGQHSHLSFKEFSQHDLQTLLQYSLVVGTNMSANEAVQLDHFLFDNNIPFVYARIYGLVGHLRLSFREHTIWNSHSENDAYDLRLDSPFPEFLNLATETDLSSMTHEQHSHTPYVLLFFKAVDIWKSRNQHNGEQMEGETDLSFPDITDYRTRKEVERILMEMRQPDDKGSMEEENFAEAKRNLLKSMGRTNIPENVRKVLADPKTRPLPLPQTNRPKGPLLEDFVSPFWVLSAALRQFIEQNQQMPISGQLPDMTSDSKRYAQLLGIYRAKAMEDAVQLHLLATKILNQRRSALAREEAVPASLAPSMDTYTAASETDGSTTDENEEDDLSRMSTSENNEQQRISLSMESMEGEEEGESSTGGGQHTSESNNEESSLDPATCSTALGTRKGAISLEQCQNFCKNASKIGIQYGSSLSEEFTRNIKSILQRMEPAQLLDQLPPRVDPLTWYILLRTVDRFRAANDRLPQEESDLRDLKRCLAELFAETKDPELIARQNELIPMETLQEICRFGAVEPHVIAAIFGGCVAQEVIKLCTHQYIPVDNSLVFDGHSQQAATFRLIRKEDNDSVFN